MAQSVNITEAQLEDEYKLRALLNCAFGGFITDQITSPEDAAGGWSNDRHLFQPPRPRLDPDGSEFPLLRNEANVKYFKVEDGGKMIGSVRVEIEETLAHIGNLAVLPSHQSRGIGSILLKAAEEFAVKQGVKKIRMITLAQRGDLVDYYVRRGYKDTGERSPFPMRPTDSSVIPLEFVALEKDM